ncbi:hypothetical protein S7711_06156 [Stachybotrys chartarum IBT 7711]|uniref:Ribonuclease n=1 Tax=Stachybotrys chartarum (strain CBS 109288 / IBT 7711) TaxID=1280523 RepID=A0A084AM84_STACB|nr:hypothetical protein S7711_06156 [Stachybotrys chartarum IBT 7711]KFA54867.1 hypothetical protein S40293_09098 [Stachybotrys chartarum IBT 40293]KFA79844.1 hypothetical protein S40288_08851 [Stachybotrys chartarum IBT 40288]
MDQDEAVPASAPGSIFTPPSVHTTTLLSGASYSHFSPVPAALLPSDPSDPSSAPPCALGVDEAGRGPVLGPMVYGVFYLPLPLSDPLLRDAHHFDDSKVLTPAVRSALMQTLCAPGTDLFDACGWATTALSARDIGANMLRPVGVYNLNAQAMDATVALIKGVYARGVNIREIYVDTIGPPAAYQAKLQAIFPTAAVTVAKKADSLYPCVSAASVCAKVTRDAALETLYDAIRDKQPEEGDDGMGWGSGYPSDPRCAGWMKSNMHPLFGWGAECRFSWATAKDMMEDKTRCGVKVDWPDNDNAGVARLTDYFTAGDRERDADELGSWYGTSAKLEAF